MDLGLTGGQVSDYDAVPDLIDMDVANPRMPLADKGYDGDDVCDLLLLKGILPVNPPRANRRSPPICDYRRYQDRNRVERMFNLIEQFRRIATRYDKTARSYLAYLCLAAAKLWMPTFVNIT